ncbi:serine/threonine-protein phosphatase 2b catalytic subunit [Anaeramoeba flamelloides]|uniref:Serine/threonine-protein phosphatase 2b catalytic subunit n=1 Tax=Anaeramoeba flamelloides TaxID=1746091 RepID=A0ABQ8XFK0_9EUKA|nr:serine/threonine-protein phosphatase 2b catalytic subunit [Anaeramoeba flamelloides]
MSKRFNFKKEVLAKYNEEIYEEIMKTFDCLPLAAIVDDQFFCVHAGISPELIDVEAINEINRFQEIPSSCQLFTDILWSDPHPNYNEVGEIIDNFSNNVSRYGSYYYSFNAVKNFLEQNDLLLIIRSHESQENGHFQYRKLEETDFSSIITIFSSPNYIGTGNKGSILIYSGGSIVLKEFNGVDHPYWLPNYIDGFQWSFPFFDMKHKSIWTTIINLNSKRRKNENANTDEKNNNLNVDTTINKVNDKNENDNKQLSTYEKNPFQNVKKNRQIYYKVVSIIKILSLFSSTREKSKISKNRKVKKAIYHSDTHLNLKKFTYFENETNMSTYFSMIHRTVSFESENFQERLFKGYSKFWLATQKSNESLSEFKSSFSINSQLDSLNKRYKKKMKQYKKLKKISKEPSKKKQFRLILDFQIKKLKKKNLKRILSQEKEL